jgi:protein-tyrosine phosphatase
MKILMVCLGNICRSPLAQGILEHKAMERGLTWEVDSAGTGGWHAGQQPDSRSIDIARQRGLDITRQCARKFRSTDIDDFDLIYCMDSSNYRDVLAFCHTEAERSKVQLIMNEAYPGRNQQVPDPYTGGSQGFAHVYNMLEEACEAIVKKYA